MGKKNKDDSLENRVYLFRDLASAFLRDGGGSELLSAETSEERRRALRALGDIARTCSIVASNASHDGGEIADAITAIADPQ